MTQRGMADYESPASSWSLVTVRFCKSNSERDSVWDLSFALLRLFVASLVASLFASLCSALCFACVSLCLAWCFVVLPFWLRCAQLFASLCFAEITRLASPCLASTKQKMTAGRFWGPPSEAKRSQAKQKTKHQVEHIEQKGEEKRS